MSIYADESDDKATYVISCVAVSTIGSQPSGFPNEWNPTQDAAKAWRADLRATFNIPVRKELKGSKLATGRNSYDGGKRALYGTRAKDAYVHALSQLGFLPELSVFSVTCNRDYALYGHTRLEAVLYAMFQRIQVKCRKGDLASLLFFDEGHAEYRTLYRKACVYLPTGSNQGAWETGGLTKNVPLETTIEDANFKDSRHSHFIQIADLIAYATLTKLRAEQGRLSEREKRLSMGDLHDAIPRQILNKFVQSGGSDGIKRLT